MAKEEISQEYLRSILDYDQETGIFTWRPRDDARRGWTVRHAGKRAGTPHIAGYWNVTVDDRRYLAHRLAWFYVHGEWPKDQIDHINGVRGDDRIANLRPATSGENKCNRPAQKNNQCGRKGVRLHKASGLWHARIRRHGKEHSLGYFHDIEKAAAAYAEAAARLHGEFAHT